MNDLLFDVPWWLPTILALIGIGLLSRGNRRRQSRVQWAGTILILIATGWALMSYFVDTPKETCQKLTRRFVQSVVARDWKTFDALTDPGLAFTFTGSSWAIQDRDKLRDAIKDDAQQIGLKSAHITDIKAVQTGPIITVTITVWSDQDFTFDRPIDSSWDMEWRQAGDTWLLRQIRALRVGGASSEQIRGSLRTR